MTGDRAELQEVGPPRAEEVLVKPVGKFHVDFHTPYASDIGVCILKFFQ